MKNINFRDYTILLFITIITVITAQNTYAEFSASFILTKPSLSGQLSGTLYYSQYKLSTRFDYTVGYKEISKYNTSNPNDLFTYKNCSSQCDVTPNDPSKTMPIYNYANGDSCSPSTISTIFGSCFVCTKPNSKSAGGVSSICVKDKVSFTPVRVSLDDGTNIDIDTSSLSMNYLSNALFDPVALGWGCVLNCRSQLDIVILVDESGSIDGNFIPGRQDNGEWHDVRTFVKKFVDGFTIDVNSVNFGLVQFGLNARKVTQKIMSDGNAFNNIIDGLTKCDVNTGDCNTNQPTYTGCGIIDSVELLIDTSGSRKLRANVPKIIVIVTDGQDNQDLDPFYYSGRKWKNSPNGYQDWLIYARDNGIQIIAVGVGDDISVSYLNTLASKDTSGKPLTLYANNFTTLQANDFARDLGRKVCTASGTTSSTPCIGCLGLCACGICTCPDSSCEDYNPCTKGTCSPTKNDHGGCFFEKEICDDKNACTSDSCSVTSGCLF